MGIMIRNYWTTIIGTLAGIVTYLSQAGAKIPETRAEWVALLIGALLTGLGVASKDATTGSAPKKP